MLFGLVGSRKDDSDDLPHCVPDREQEAAWTVPRHRAAFNNDQLVWRVREVGTSNQGHLVQGQPGPTTDFAGRVKGWSFPSLVDYV